jgi:phosphoserine aminotransferase
VLNEEYKDLENEFLDIAKAKGLVGVKGHRSVGGFRASMYNALPKQSVVALIEAMKEFEKNKVK